ncbi:LysR substrate-binding domain-containing protein [Sphingopyxis fribergensis]
MLRETPNLDWLRVFAATAATESFALAATRLGVTPGAVSQRIKALEAFLRTELFQRYPQGVRLTEAGRRYAQRVAPALDELTVATRDITASAAIQSVRVTILPALAQLWLGPRLEAFHAIEANINVEIWADAAIVDLKASNFDIAIRYGRPPFAGCDHRPLLFDELVPVASPTLMESSTLDGRGLPVGASLIADPFWENDFSDWLAATGQQAPNGLSTQTYSLYSMTVDAVRKGRGFMIGHTALVGDLIDNGELIALSGRRIPSPKQFYLLTKSDAKLSRAADAFARWILEIGSAPTSL